MPRKKKTAEAKVEEEKITKDLPKEKENKEEKKPKEKKVEEPVEEVKEEVKEEEVEEVEEEVEEVAEEPAPPKPEPPKPVPPRQEPPKPPVPPVYAPSKPEKKTNVTAIVSFIFSLVGGVILTVLGFFLGIIGAIRSKKLHSGLGLSIFSIIIAVFKLIIFGLIIAAIALVVNNDKVKEEFQEQFCKELERNESNKEACTKKEDGTYNCIFATCDFDNVKEDKDDKEETPKKEDNKKEDNKKEDNKKEEPKKEDKTPTPTNKKMSFINYKKENYEVRLYAAYNDGTTEPIGKDLDIINYYLDGNILYYVDRNKNLYSIDITDKNAKPKDQDFMFENTNYFGVKDGKLYYFLLLDNEKFAAVTYDLINRTEEKRELGIEHLNTLDIQGTIGYYEDKYQAGVPSYVYSYDFITNKTTKLGEYDYILENRVNKMLLKKWDSKQNIVCLYDKQAKKEQFCIDLNKYKETNQIYSPYPVTIKNNSILLLVNNEIRECTSATNCDKVLYKLTEEEANEPYKLVLYYANRLVLAIGYDEVCDGGCTYKFHYYDLTNNKKEISIPFRGDAYNELTFYE